MTSFSHKSSIHACVYMYMYLLYVNIVQYTIYANKYMTLSNSKEITVKMKFEI